ncbi:hypothetical protein E2562_032081 [Oryza meyeriana var. granulata]|uniref:Uncharacterized protein n=1 Tax=Oryza meyeriana var. granulata TaxID=110450 RepID=A0A6G1CLG5_9ORYZ|nr:hypothetical protein E2562_032081 [Oryza meyeriana var. granulata]
MVYANSDTSLLFRNVIDDHKCAFWGIENFKKIRIIVSIFARQSPRDRVRSYQYQEITGGEREKAAMQRTSSSDLSRDMVKLLKAKVGAHHGAGSTVIG